MRKEPKCKPYADGTTLEQIIDDGWFRGFKSEQTLREAAEMGYSLDKATLLKRWAEQDYLYEKAFPSTLEGQ